jgi:hypothetical protein
MSSTIRRAKKDAANPYKAIRRATFEDSRLSWEARGLLGYLLVKPDDWKINVAHLMHQAPGGRDRVYRIINELIEHGYIQRNEVRANGKIAGYDYLVFEEPYTENPQQFTLLPEEPYTDEPDAVAPLPEKPYPVLPLTANTHISKEEEEQNNNLPPQVTATENPLQSGGKEIDAEKERRKELKTAWVEASRAENYTPAQVNKGIVLLDKAGCTPAELDGCYAWMAGDPYWQDATIYPQSIFKKLDEYRRFRQRVHVNGNGKTSTWAQAFANQEVPDYIRKMQEAA